MIQIDIITFKKKRQSQVWGDSLLGKTMQTRRPRSYVKAGTVFSATLAHLWCDGRCRKENTHKLVDQLALHTPGRTTKRRFYKHRERRVRTLEAILWYPNTLAHSPVWTFSHVFMPAHLRYIPPYTHTDTHKTNKKSQTQPKWKKPWAPSMLASMFEIDTGFTGFQGRS